MSIVVLKKTWPKAYVPLHKSTTCKVLLLKEAQKTLQTFIDEDLWDQAFVYVGKISLEKGIKAPVLNTRLHSKKNIKDTNLFIYKKQHPMIPLVLSIIASTFIFVLFRLFARYSINTLQAIVVNYFVACTCGIIGYQNSIEISAIPKYDWFYYTVALGALFIIVFNLMATTTQRSGLSVVSVATKMALVIPIGFGLWYYQEPLGPFKAIGIILALAAVYLVSVKKP